MGAAAPHELVPLLVYELVGGGGIVRKVEWLSPDFKVTSNLAVSGTVHESRKVDEENTHAEVINDEVENNCDHPKGRLEA